MAVIVTPIMLGLMLKGLNKDVPPPGQMIDVGGYRLHINCIGPQNDLPTVIIESGSGMATPYYHWIQQDIAETTRVCAYDRSGLGWSDESGLRRDSKTVNEALHTLLDKAHIKRPFVFVGHSIAGLYTRDYIGRYPGEVSGLVLLDPSHPDQDEIMKLDRKSSYTSLEQQTSVLKTMINLGLVELYNPVEEGPVYEFTLDYPLAVQDQLKFAGKRTETYVALLAEFRDFTVAGRQAAQNMTFGDMPFSVISAGKILKGKDWPEDLDPKKILGIFQNLHNEMGTFSSNSTQVTIDAADHMSLIINKDHAAQTLPYIRDIILKAAGGMQP